MERVSIVLGTRPEAIKLYPVILALREDRRFTPHVCVTGQHRELLDQVLAAFSVTPDVDLDLMRPGQTLAELTARTIAAVDRYLDEYRPQIVLVQGDTTTVLGASLAAFYRNVRIGHVEAGLRTGNRHAPFPEETNRVLTSRLAEWHFAPTPQARRNLLAEGIAEEQIYVTGNTVVDALGIALQKTRDDPPEIPGLPRGFIRGEASRQATVLITGHRRESFGRGFESICRAIRLLADRFPQVAFVYPVHLNPRVRVPVFEALRDRSNVYLIEPVDYPRFVALMDRSTLLLTDSGGLQEEAPSLGKPVLVMRQSTERPEGLEAGTAKLVGTDTDTIVQNVSMLLTDPELRRNMSRSGNPYGDGRAAERIVAILERAVRETACAPPTRDS